MSRSLTNLTADLYTAVDIISRELVGFIPAVSSDMTHERAAIGETVYSPVTASATATDITPSVTPPDDGDNTITDTPLTITKARRVPVRINGEQQRILNDSVGWTTVRAMEFAQAMRTLVNEIERDLAGLYSNASRAHGTAGASPFGSNIKDAASLQKILDDNGAPQTDRQLIINTGAAVNLASLTQLTNVSDAGTSDLLRRGVLSDLFGFQVRKSAQVANHAAGSGTGYLIDLTAGYSKGDTTLHVDTGTADATGIITGDVIVIDADSSASKYVVATGTALAEADIVIRAPGLMGAVANNAAVTVAANYAANMAFSRSAMYLATRAPATPDVGDSADDAMIVTDPVSGLSFEIREYRQYRQVQYEVSIAWGVACVKPEHCAILLG